MKKHVIWQNIDLDFDDYKEELKNNLEEDEEMPSDDDIWMRMAEDNELWLDDERANLNIGLPSDIVVLADVGLWHGRRAGFRFMGSNLRDILYEDGIECCEWYVDQYGNLKATMHHHDGTNYLEYRLIRPDLSDDQRERFEHKLRHGELNGKALAHYTMRLGDVVGDVYGWKFSGKRPKTA